MVLKELVSLPLRYRSVSTNGLVVMNKIGRHAG